MMDCVGAASCLNFRIIHDDLIARQKLHLETVNYQSGSFFLFTEVLLCVFCLKCFMDKSLKAF